MWCAFLRGRKGLLHRSYQGRWIGLWTSPEGRKEEKQICQWKSYEMAWKPYEMLLHQCTQHEEQESWKPWLISRIITSSACMNESCGQHAVMNVYRVFRRDKQDWRGSECNGEVSIKWRGWTIQPCQLLTSVWEMLSGSIIQLIQTGPEDT